MITPAISADYAFTYATKNVIFVINYTVSYYIAFCNIFNGRTMRDKCAINFVKTNKQNIFQQLYSILRNLV